MNFKNRGKYLKIALAAALAGCLIIIFSYIVFDTKSVIKGIDTVMGIFMPFIVGMAFAYLMCPLYNLCTKKMYTLFIKREFKETKALSLAKTIATFVSMVVLLGIIVGFFMLLIPSITDTVKNLIDVLPKQFSDAAQWIQGHLQNHPDWAENITKIFDKVKEGFLDWAKGLLVSDGNVNVFSSVYESVSSIFKVILDFVVGIIVCVYFLNDKEKFLAQIKKTILATMKPARADSLFELGSMAHKVFGGFINGKIIDSFIIGLLCFFSMLILGLPYPALISTIIGITNIIPFFGPIIGGIPSVLLILLKSPVDSLIFLVLVLVLQQLDGYVLGPKIIGGSTGLSSFWVMFAILVFSGLFGFPGMILGVPVFALVYTYISRYLSRRLTAKNLPDDTEEYKVYNQYGIDNKRNDEKNNDNSI